MRTDFESNNPNPYEEATLPRHEDGGIMVNGVQSGSTIRCCHCGGHFMVVRGSGKVRGFCRRCMKPTCGDPHCDPCAPFLARLDEAEGKITKYHDAIVDSGFIL